MRLRVWSALLLAFGSPALAAEPVVLSPASAVAAANGLGDIHGLLKEQLARYPRMELQDCYKLLFQACLGSEHAVTDSAAAARWMNEEIARLGNGPTEPMIDPITPDGSLVRVHLRAWIQQGRDPQALVNAFVATGRGYTGSRAALADAWAQVVALAAEGTLPFAADDARQFGQRMADAGYPVAHHSKTFNALYHPAYRVVAKAYLPSK